MTMRSAKNTSRTRLRLLSCLIVVLTSALFLSYVHVEGARDPSLSMSSSPAEPDNNLADPPVAHQEKDFSRFTHTNEYHSRMPCLLCHRRDTNSSRISFPGKAGHTPCIGCHAAQFSDNTSPICTICHTATGMKAFPRLKTFGRKFDHPKHSRVNCAVCHKTSQGGVGFSIPSGANAHATCIQCHSSSSTASMSSCSVCHQQGPLVRTPETARSFRANFSHSKHTRTGMSCASCHSVRPGATGKQVASPVLSMHFPPAGRVSCGNCHNGTKTFGANDFANCKRCHNGNTFRF